jgi:hypothetical protein
MTKRMKRALEIAMDLHKNYGLPIGDAADIAVVSLLERKSKKPKKLVELIEHNLSSWRLSESFRAG